MIISGSLFVIYSQIMSQLKDIIEHLKIKNDNLHEELKKVNKVYEIPSYGIMATNKIIETKNEWFQKYRKIIGNSFIELRASQEQERFEIIISDFFRNIIDDYNFLEEYLGKGKPKQFEGRKGFNFDRFKKELEKNGVLINDEINKYHDRELLENFAEDGIYSRLGEDAEYLIDFLNERRIDCDVEKKNNFLFVLLVMKFKNMQYN
jgi:hypothetical protein